MSTVMMLAQETSWWYSNGETLLWIASIFAALGVLVKTPFLNKPLLWLWRHLVSDPLGQWAERSFERVVDKKITSNNGGSTTKDHLDTLSLQQEKTLEMTKAALQRTEETQKGHGDVLAALNNLHECMDRRFTESNDRLEKLTFYTEEVLSEATGAKERIRQLYRALDVAVYETDMNGLCTYINPAYSKMTGLSFDQCLGEGWMEAVEEPDRNRVHRGWNNAVSASVDFNSIFTILNVSTRETVEVRGSAMPLHDSSKTVVGWIGTLDPLDLPEGSNMISTPKEYFDA